MKKPLVSVIVPNYNHAPFLVERLETILSQKYPELELIILDDASTDGSHEILESYSDRDRVAQIVFNTVNSGSAFAQWRKGIEKARGEYIWIAESDDSCDSSFLDTMIRDITRKKGTVMAFCRSMCIDEKNRELGVHPNQEHLEDRFRMKGEKFIKKWLGVKNTVVNASSVVFRKDAALNVSDDYSSYKGVGDWLFWIEIARQGYVAFNPKALNRFRRHEGNTTQRMQRDGTGILECMKVYNYLRDKGYLGKVRFFRIRVDNVFRVKYQMEFPGMESDLKEVRRAARQQQKDLLTALDNNFWTSLFASLKRRRK